MSPLAVLMGKAGFLLFTLGLLLGFAIPKLRNPRMGLSAHLTAVQTGPALIAFALFWRFLAVPTPWEAPLIWILCVASYALVTGILFAAVSGASEALPIAGSGYRASKAKETGVAILVKGSSLAMALVCLAIAWFAIADLVTAAAG